MSRSLECLGRIAAFAASISSGVGSYSVLPCFALAGFLAFAGRGAGVFIGAASWAGLGFQRAGQKGADQTMRRRIRVPASPASRATTKKRRDEVKFTKTRKSDVAMVAAMAFQIWCQRCDRDDPIPSSDGSLMWDTLPYSVWCPSCGQVSRTPRMLKV